MISAKIADFFKKLETSPEFKYLREPESDTLDNLEGIAIITNKKKLRIDLYILEIILELLESHKLLNSSSWICKTILVSYQNFLVN